MSEHIIVKEENKCINTGLLMKKCMLVHAVIHTVNWGLDDSSWSMKNYLNIFELYKFYLYKNVMLR